MSTSNEDLLQTSCLFYIVMVVIALLVGRYTTIFLFLRLMIIDMVLPFFDDFLLHYFHQQAHQHQEDNHGS